MKIAVTGGYGHLGSIFYQGIGKFGIHDVFRTSADVRDLAKVQKELEALRPDLVIHCAALVGSSFCDRAGRDWTLSVNQLGTYNVATIAQHLGARLLMMSSCSIYDPAGQRPYSEDDEAAVKPATLYGESKWAAETTARGIMDPSRIIVLRPTFVYGLHHDISLITQLSRAAASHSAVVFDMEYSNMKSYLWDEDFFAAAWGLITAEKSGVFNIASDNYYTWAEFRDMLIADGGWPQYVIHRPELDYKGHHVISTLKLHLAIPTWEEQMPITKGIRKVVASMMRDRT